MAEAKKGNFPHPSRRQQKSSKTAMNRCELKNKPQKSSPRCLPGRYLAQPPKKHQKIMILGYPETLRNRISRERGNKTHQSHRTQKRYQKYLKNIPAGAPKSSIFNTFGDNWRSKLAIKPENDRTGRHMKKRQKNETQVH